MAKEGGPDQTALFTGKLLEASLPAPLEVPSATVVEKAFKESEVPISAVVPTPTKREAPKATLREIRAVRSLLYNRLLLERVLIRMEKAEAIILSYLLTQDAAATQIGVYLVELDPNSQIHITQTETDCWRQQQFAELEAWEELGGH